MSFLSLFCSSAQNSAFYEDVLDVFLYRGAKIKEMKRK